MYVYDSYYSFPILKTFCASRHEVDYMYLIVAEKIQFYKEFFYSTVVSLYMFDSRKTGAC